MRTRPRDAARAPTRRNGTRPGQPSPRLAETELERTHRALEQKTTFINMAAHELSTPMMPIILSTRMLRETLDAPDEAARHLDALDRNVDRLRRLLTNLLDAARMQSSHLPIDPEPLDLRVVARDLATTYHTAAAHKDITLTLDQGHEPVLAYADPARVTQVLANLVDNAIKYSPPHTAIVVRVHPSARGGSIEVQDEGIGMTAEQQARLFEPFQRMHQGTQAPGTGLGLYLSRGLVERQGGTLECHSTGPGQGCTFRLDLSDELTTSPRRRIDQRQDGPHTNVDGSMPLP